MTEMEIANNFCQQKEIISQNAHHIGHHFFPKIRFLVIRAITSYLSHALFFQVYFFFFELLFCFCFFLFFLHTI
jgi:hypothetical protein